MLRRSPMVQWSQPHQVKNMGGYHGEGPLGSCLCSAKCFAGTWRLPSGCSNNWDRKLKLCGWACGWCIPFLGSICWWFSMSLGAKITILCYTFGLNRIHQVPLVYHHFPHWNWSLKARLIFLDKLMFFPRGLFEAFLCVCVAAVYIKPPTQHATCICSSAFTGCYESPAQVLQPGCGSMGSIFS